ncbi:response regulator [Magnetococcus sp. PR-3]|uniref:response regulator n=1 Tax=Magnetococcus sp. PR-3 TaxID=3120355 RepID=UPI002FCE4D62
MSKKVLIVDDSFIMRAIVKEIIESDDDFSVIAEAENGRIGLQMVREHTPDLILLDIEMPEMTGLEMLKRLRLLGKFKTIIVSSVGQVGSEEAVQARKLGAADVIAKPSGAMSLDLADKRGHDIVAASRAALGLPPLAG